MKDERNKEEDKKRIEEFFKKRNIDIESLTEESVLKDFQEDIDNLPDQYKSRI